jgi:dynein heavy chain
MILSILDTNSEPSAVLSLISELSIQIDSIERTKNKYENWGSLFQRGGVLMVAAAEGEEIAVPEKSDKNLYDPRKYEEMMETKQEINLKKIMWAGIQEWNLLEMYNRLYL